MDNTNIEHVSRSKSTQGPYITEGGGGVALIPSGKLNGFHGLFLCTEDLCEGVQSLYLSLLGYLFLCTGEPCADLRS